jgi:hypothetical protein
VLLPSSQANILEPPIPSSVRRLPSSKEISSDPDVDFSPLCRVAPTMNQDDACVIFLSPARGSGLLSIQKNPSKEQFTIVYQSRIRMPMPWRLDVVFLRATELSTPPPAIVPLCGKCIGLSNTQHVIFAEQTAATPMASDPLFLHFTINS